MAMSPEEMREIGDWVAEIADRMDRLEKRITEISAAASGRKSGDPGVYSVGGHQLVAKHKTGGSTVPIGEPIEPAEDDDEPYYVTGRPQVIDAASWPPIGPGTLC